MQLVSTPRASVSLSVEIEKWPLASPFRISGYVFDKSELVVVKVLRAGKTGRGEAAGVYYKNDTPALILEQIEEVRNAVEAGIDRARLQTLLPAGGARNALDCALWDLEAQIGGRSAASLAGFENVRPLITTFTCGAADPVAMAETARGYLARFGARAIKLKLTGEAVDKARIEAVRDALPNVWLAVDANQGFTRSSIEELMPTMVAARVELIEQPFRVGEEALLDGLNSPIPIAADESVQTSADIPDLVGRVQIINIKLDKCGGLTEGLIMAETAREMGLEAMVGNMIGTSLAMVPSFLLGQNCKVVDLDGPVFLERDRDPQIIYRNGYIRCDNANWGRGRDLSVVL